MLGNLAATAALIVSVTGTPTVVTPAPTDAPEAFACETGTPAWVTIPTASDATPYAVAGDVLCVEHTDPGTYELPVVGGGSIEASYVSMLHADWPAQVSFDDDASYVALQAGAPLFGSPDRASGGELRNAYIGEHTYALTDLETASGMVPVRVDGEVAFVYAGAVTPAEEPADGECVVQVMALYAMTARTDQAFTGAPQSVTPGDVLCAAGMTEAGDVVFEDGSWLNAGEAVRLPDRWTGDFAYDTELVVLSDDAIELGLGGALAGSSRVDKLLGIPSTAGLSGGVVLRPLEVGETVYADLSEHHRMVGSTGLVGDATYVPVRMASDSLTGWITLASLGEPGSVVATPTPTAEPSTEPTSSAAPADEEPGVIDKAKSWWSGFTDKLGGDDDDTTKAPSLLARTAAIPALVGSLALSVTALVLALLGSGKRSALMPLALRLLSPAAIPLSILAAVAGAALAPVAAHAWSGYVAAAVGLLAVVPASFAWSAKLSREERWIPLNDSAALLAHVKQPRTWLAAAVAIPVGIVLAVIVPGALATATALVAALAVALGWATRAENPLPEPEQSDAPEDGENDGAVA